METINFIFNLVIFCGIIFLFKYYLPSYLKEKGKNLAQKEDIASITTEVEKVKADYSSQIERLKSELDKTILVHKLQFETEFQTYKDIWEKLLIVRYRSLDLHPIMNRNLVTEEEENRIRKECISGFVESFNSFSQLAEKNKPFYSKYIWKELEKLLEIFKKEAVRSQFIDPSHFEITYWDEMLKDRDKVLLGIDSICDAIRNRIESLKTV